MENYDHFYDGQIRRYLLQLVRGFSGFQYARGKVGDAEPEIRVVPCILAKRSRQASAIQRNNSENMLNTVPIITIDHNGLRPDSSRIQNPNHVSKVQVFERKRNEFGELTNERGQTVTVERLMPRSFFIDVQVDIWTSNMDQKHQLFEQILSIIYPTFDIQNSDNALDWTSLQTVQVKDVTWTASSYPIGSDSEIEVGSINLEIPILISPPAKIKRANIIEKVITNINEAIMLDNGMLGQGNTDATITVTPNNYHIKASAESISLLGDHAASTDPDGNPYTWENLQDEYKRPIIKGITQIRLKYNEDDENEIIGIVQSFNEDVLQWQLVAGSLPVNTLSPVTAVINPMRSFPNGQLQPPSQGQRYLITTDLPPNTDAWGSIGAFANDIIQFTNGEWVVSFSSRQTENVNYLVNQHTSKQLRFSDGEWSTAIDGVYSPRYWRIV